MDARDETEFLSFLRKTFKTDDIRLERLPQNCADCAYRLTVAGGEPIFCKRTRVVMPHVLQFLLNLPETPLVVKLIGPKCLEYKQERVLFYEWCEVKPVPIVDMSEEQFSSFVEGCRELPKILSRAEKARDPWNGEELMAAVRSYCARYKLAKYFFRALLSLDSQAYNHSNVQALPIIHGDFHKRNLGFTEAGRLVFLDFDLMVHGVPAEDVTQFVEGGMRHMTMLFNRKRRNLLLSRYERLIRRLPYPLSDWRLALNRIRLMSAYDVIEAKGDSFKAAREFLRRDLPIIFMDRLLKRLEAEGRK